MPLRMMVTAGLLLLTACGPTPAAPGSGTTTSSNQTAPATGEPTGATSGTARPKVPLTPTTLEPPSPVAGCPAFSLQLVSTRGGQPTPLAAVQWFQRNGNVVVDLPSSGWREERRDATGVVVRSGRATLHVLKGPDGTWRVDSGRSC